METMDDFLIRQCLAGDEAAWTTIVESYARRVFNLSCRFVGRPDEAEELTQEIFIRVYQSLHSYRINAGSFPSWLFRIARNLLIDHLRKTRHYRRAVLGQVDAVHLSDDRNPDPLRALEQAEAARILRRALRTLSSRSREAIVLRDLEGMEYQEVAAILGVPEGTVKSRINRGRLELARLVLQQRCKARYARNGGRGKLSGNPPASCPALQESAVQ